MADPSALLQSVFTLPTQLQSIPSISALIRKLSGQSVLLMMVYCPGFRGEDKAGGGLARAGPGEVILRPNSRGLFRSDVL